MTEPATPPVAVTVTAIPTWLRELVGGVLTVVFIACALFSWLQEHDARLKAEATSSALVETITEQQKSIEAAKADQAQVAQSLQQQMAAIEAEKQKPVTAPQFMLDLSKVIPALPQAAQVVTPPPTEQNVSGKMVELPSAPVVQIPEIDLPALRDYKLSCDENSAQLIACKATTADLNTQLAGVTAQYNARTKEAAIWEATAKGGTFWTRLKSSLKCIAISGGSAGLGALLDKKQPAVGAMIGVAAGEVGCRTF